MLLYIINAMKKKLREPLLYLLPLLVIVFFITTNTNDNKPEILDVKLTRNNITEVIKFPYLTNDIQRGEVFSVSFNLLVKDNFAKLNIIPDDCILEISINGDIFPIGGAQGLCDTQKGVTFDFSKYAQKDLNHFNIRIDNRGGGPAGLNATANLPKQFSLVHYIFVLLLLASVSLMLWKSKNNERTFKSVLLFAATTIFLLIASQYSRIIPPDSIWFLAAILFGAAFVFLLDKRVNYTAFVFILTVLTAFMLVRGGLLYFKSIDYNNFLTPWLKQMHELSLAEAISAKIGDYNMPYLYVLALISRFEINSLYLIKIVSIAFDVVLAYYVMKIVSIKFNSINAQLAAFVLTFGIPTVILNGAFWAQCDVIYAALAIASLYYGFTGKSIRCFIFFGLAFSVKLQTIFIAPMLIVFLFTKKIKIIHLWIPVLTFFVILVPALIAGKPFVETLSIYYEQTHSYPQMVLNTPNIYALLGNVRFENFNFAAIFITGIAVASLLYFLYVNKEKIISPSNYVSIAFVFVLLMPMLLPRMHERYFFLADVLAVAFAFFYKKRWYFAPIIILGSFMTYSRFLLGREYIVPIEYASLAMIFITFVAIKDLVEEVLS